MSKQQTLKRAAATVRKAGKRGDTVLAHISPAEAKYLQAHFGGDKNPKTGLPQFGFWGSLGRSLRGKSGPKWLRKTVGTVLPLAGMAVGNMIAPGSGAILGGALGSGVSGKGNMVKNLIKGGLMGLGYNYLAPQLGSALGVGEGGTLGAMMGVGAPSMLNAWGVPNLIGAGGLFGGAAAGAEAAGAGGLGAMTGYGPEMATEGGGLLSGLFGAGAGGGALDNMLKLGALGAIVQGVRKGKSEYKPYKGPSLQQRMIAEGMTPPTIIPYKPPKPILRKKKEIKNSNIFSPEMMEEEYFEPLPWPGTYARGGEAHETYFHGASGGQDDNRRTKMHEKSYVIDATTLSLYGDGNSEAGLHKLNQLKEKARHAAHQHGYQQPKNLKVIDAMVSDGEDIWKPEEIFGLGVLAKGDGNKGVTAMNEFRKNLRKQKGVKEFLPPKSKHAAYYIEGKKHVG